MKYYTWAYTVTQLQVRASSRPQQQHTQRSLEASFNSMEREL